MVYINGNKNLKVILMVVYSSVKKRLKTIINELSAGNEKVLLFFKGFNSEFYKEVLNDLISLNDKFWLDSAGYIDVLKLEEDIKNLTLKFLTSQDKVICGFYEEFIAISNSLNNMAQYFEGKIYIVDNNLFDKYYPISVNFEIGDLEVTPNREQILYSKTNVDKICKKLDAVQDELDEIINSQIKTDFTDYNEYINVLENSNTNEFKDFMRKK